MSDAYKVALIRGVVTAVLAGGLAFLTGLQQGQSVRVALIAGGVQLIYNLIARIGVEGTIDNQQAPALPAAAPPPPK
jgi:hypothetical protein